MNKSLQGLIPVGAPWGGPESFKFLSCFSTLYMHLKRDTAVPELYCDRDIKICDRCNQCGEFIWERKCHEQVYHDFLTLTGLSCLTLWPDSHNQIDWICSPTGLVDDTYIWRTLEFTGYNYRLVEGKAQPRMWLEIKTAIDRGVPVLAYHLCNNDWCLVSGYEDDGDRLLGYYVREDWDEPDLAPDAVEEGVFSKTDWYNSGVRLLIVEGKTDQCTPIGDLFGYLHGVLRQPPVARGTTGLAAFDACKAVLLDEELYSGSTSSLIPLYRMIHTFIGALAEARCFAAFAFWSGIFGRVKDVQTQERMKTIGDTWMQTHNECWGAWAVLGKDHQCQPEQYMQKFVELETRRSLAAYMDNFRVNDEKVIRILEEIQQKSAV